MSRKQETAGGKPAEEISEEIPMDNYSVKKINSEEIPMDNYSVKYVKCKRKVPGGIDAIDWVDAANAAIEWAFSRFVFVADKPLFVCPDTGNVSRIKEADIQPLLVAECPEAVYGDKVTVDVKTLRAYLHRENGFDLLEYETDPFAPKPRVIFDREHKILRIVKNKIHLVKPEERVKLSKERREAIIADYREQFPTLDDFLDFVVACRFSPARKTSFLHLLTPSDWGKSFLMGCMDDLECSCEVDYSDFLTDRPKGTNVPVLRRAMVLFIDEFTHFPKSLKGKTHRTFVEPKYGYRQTVPVFAKVFLSAEESESFVGGVDDQIRNRVLVMDMRNGCGKLTDRPRYNDNREAYKTAVKTLLYEELKKRIDGYLGMGYEKASIAGDQTLERLHARYRISGKEDLNAIVVRRVIEYIRHVLDTDPDVLTRTEQEVTCLIGRDDDNVYIYRFDRTMEMILKDVADEAFYKKARYKKTILRNLLGGTSKTLRNGKKVVRAYVIPKKRFEELLSTPV